MVREKAKPFFDKTCLHAVWPQVNQTPLWNKTCACKLAAKNKPFLKNMFACKCATTYPLTFWETFCLQMNSNASKSFLKILTYWSKCCGRPSLMRVPLFSSFSVSPLMPLLEWWQLDVQKRLLGLWHGICLQICRKRTNNLFCDKCFCMEINRKRASNTFEPNLIANWQHASKTVLQTKSVSISLL